MNACSKIMAASAVVLLISAAVAVAQSQRFTDVPPSHEDHAAVEWAASAGITLGYGDGTFGPDKPLPKSHALLFMERYYDDVLGADESAGFTRGDMMRLLKAINDAAPAPAGKEAAVPAGEAKGRCAVATAMRGVYDWEICAWGTTPDPEMSRSAMNALVDKVWAETDAPGKPAARPTLTEGHCGWDVLGCYLPSAHTVKLDTGFTRHTLLHELAHALISDAPEMAGCDDDWTHTHPECYHGTLYRCTADGLYVRYGGTQPAGVCGSPPDLRPGDWVLQQGVETEWGTIHAIASVGDGGYWLHVRCSTNYDIGDKPAVDVLITLPVGQTPTGDATWRVPGGKPVKSAWDADKSLWLGDSLPAAWSGTLYVGIDYQDSDYRTHTGRATFELGDNPGPAVVADTCKAAA